MEHLFLIFKTLYLLTIGILLPYFYHVPYYVYILFGFINMILLAISLEREVSEKTRIRNYFRCVLSIYIPVAVFSLIQFLFIIVHIEMYIVVLFFLLLCCFFNVFLRKKAMVPYLLLVSSMPYERIKEESKHLYEQRKTENTMMVIVYMSLLSVVAMIQSSLYYYGILKFNFLSLVPLFLIEAYGSVCKSAIMHGNEHSRGRFSLKAFCTLLVLCVVLPVLGYSNVYDLYLKTWTLQKNQDYRIASLFMDYETNEIRVKGINIFKEDVSFLKNVYLQEVPIKYEIYYVDEIVNRANSIGTTIIKDDVARSFITNGENNDMLEIVFYHEYMHVLIHCLEDSDALLEEYEKLRVDDYKRNEWERYYVSDIALENVLEDICDQYAFYMADESYRESIKNKPYHKKKCDVIREYMMEEYGYDFYEE